MKYSNWFGIAAAVVLVYSCTMNWAWYPDVKQFFTGFYSLDNMYGKPGKVFIFMGALAVIFYLIPRAWAKRWNLLVCALILAYAIKTFILFSACYRGICPDRQAGLWVMLFASAAMMVAALFPGGKLKPENSYSKKSGNQEGQSGSNEAGEPNP
jgi:hypothetical protein